MVYQTALLFKLDIPSALYCFVAGGTLCSYNFHWYLTPPGGTGSTTKYWSLHNKPLHLILFFIGFALSCICSILLIKHWPWLLVSAFFTFLYSAPKIPHPVFQSLQKIAVGKTVFLAFAWMHVTTLLPLVILNGNLYNEQIIFAVNRFFFIYAICVLFDYRDRRQDSIAGIRSLITQLPEQGVDFIFWGSILVAGITAFLLLGYFSSWVVLALVIPIVLLSLLYSSSKKNFSNLRYYFVLDGLMMLSAPLVVLAKFAR